MKKLLKRILLLFKKPYYGCDIGFGKDKVVIIEAKKLFGKIYIIKVHKSFKEVKI